MVGVGLARLGGSTTAAALLAFTAPFAAHAQQQTVRFNLPAQTLGGALRAFGQVSNQQIIFSEDSVRGKRSPQLIGRFTVSEGLQRLLAGSDLTITRSLSGLISVAPPSLADGPAEVETSSELAELVVTGSRIRRFNTITAAPVTVLDASEISEFGYTQVGQMLNQETSNSPITPTPPFVGVPVFNAGRQAPNLFDLGVGRTLTLMNGRRMVTTSSGLDDSAVDTNIIPTGLIQRVDIVEAGGAAVYGSDAIAGVVNYILKQNFHGVVLDAQYGDSSRFDYPQPSLRATIGTNFASGRGNIAADIEWSKTDALLQFDRPASAASAVPVNNPAYTGQAGVAPEVYASNVRYWALNTNGVLFNASRPGPAFLLGGAANALQFSPDGQSIIPYNPGNDITGGLAVGGQGQDPRDTSSLAAGVQRATATVIGHYDLTPHVKLSGEFTYGWTQSQDPYSTQDVARFAGGAKSEGQSAFGFTNANPYLTPSEIATLNAVSPTFASGGQVFESRFLNILPTREEIATTNTGRAVVALDGDFHALDREFTWSTSFSHAWAYGINTQWASDTAHLVNSLDSVRNASGQIVCAINALAVADPSCAPLDPFGNLPASPAAQSYISVKTGSSYLNTQDDLLATLGGDVVTLPGGTLKFSASYERRAEGADFKPFFANQFGLIYGGETTAPVSGHYNTNELSGEVLVPVVGGDFTLPFVKALELTGSYRYVDNSLAGKEAVWGAGVRWEVAFGLTLRASRSRNFRAPTLDDLIAPHTTTVSFLGSDPCNRTEINSGSNPSVRAANCVALFAANPQYGPLANFLDPATNTSIVAVTSGGNASLKNEISNTTTWGFVYQPVYVPGLSITADRIQVDLTNGLSSFGPANFLNTCFDLSPQPAAICNTFTRDPATGYVTTAEQTTYNAGSILFEGEVYKFSYRFPIDRFLPVHDWGTVEWDLQATHTAVEKTSVTGFDHTRTDGTIEDPSWRVRLDLHYSRGPLRLFYSMYYLPPSRLSPNATIATTPVPVVAANVTHTVSAQYDIHNITLRAGINNLTDQGPSFPTVSYGDIFGREFFVGATARF
jgi:outer membrane receptor protein involved in Fe transport